MSLDRRALLGIALHVPAPLLPGEVIGPRLEHRRRDHARLVAHLARDDRHRPARHRCGAAAVGAEPVRGLVGVAVAHLHVLGRDPELLGDDLGERRLVALALGLGAEADHRLAGRVHAQVGPVVHRQAEDVHVLARPGADALCEERDADPHQLAAGALLGLLAAQVVVARDVHRDLHRLGVVARVVRPAGGRLVGELAGLDEAAHAQLDRIGLHLEGEGVHHPLDEVHGLGDPERAAVGHASGRLVRVHRLDLHVRRLQGRRSRSRCGRTRPGTSWAARCCRTPRGRRSRPRAGR